MILSKTKPRTITFAKFFIQTFIFKNTSIEQLVDISALNDKQIDLIKRLANIIYYESKNYNEHVQTFVLTTDIIGRIAVETGKSESRVQGLVLTQNNRIKSNFNNKCPFHAIFDEDYSQVERK